MRASLCGVAGAVALCAGCCGSASSSHLPVLPNAITALPEEDTGAAPAVDLGSIPAAVRPGLEQTVRLAQKTVQLRRFRDALRGLKHLATGNGDYIDGTEVDKLLLGLASPGPARTRYFVSGISDCKKHGHETARTGIEYEEGGTALGLTAVAETCLQVVVLQRAQAGTDGEVACAINTLVHEWMHTIPDAPEPSKLVQPDYAFTDRGHGGSSGDLVSYTVGALAQCVYLEQRQVEIDPRSSVDLKVCLEQVGKWKFVADTCAWSTSPPDAGPAEASSPPTRAR